MMRLLVLSLLVLFSAQVWAGPRACEIITGDSISITSQTPILGEAQIKEVRELTADAAEVVFGEFPIPKDLKVELYERVRSAHIFATNTIWTSFDYTATFLNPTPERIDRYWKKHSPKFRAKKLYIHELAHGFFFGEFIAAIPKFREFQDLGFEILGRHPELLEQAKASNNFQVPDSVIEEEKESLKKLEELSKYNHMLTPFNELLADFAAALYFDEANIYSEHDLLSWRGEHGLLLTYILRGKEYTLRYRDFDTKYSPDTYFDLFNAHTLFGMTRSYLWKLYKKNKGRVSKSHLLRLVFDAAVAEINARIAEDRIFSADVRLEGRRFLQDVNAYEVNSSLITRFNQIQGLLND